MRIATLRLCAAIGIALAATAAAAQNATPATAPAASEDPVRSERAHVTYTVQPDGSYVEQHETELKVLDERAVEYAKRESISYSASIQRFEVIEAYTRKADGRRIEVPKSNYQVETNDGREGGGPAFSDIATTSLIFPDVAAGDTVVLSYRLIGKQPMFDRQFSELDSFSNHRYAGDVRIKIDAPAAMWAQHKAWGALKQVRDETVGDRRIVEWSYQNRAPAKSKRTDYSVYQVEDFPGFAYSTFRSYGDIARVYGERALPKAVPTARARKLADEIAAGKTAPREVARALYEWVSTNIHYGGNCIGLGAVVPRDQDFVLDNRLGDCKDHATLLQALLAAKGIEASQALVNAGNVYRLPEIPVASSVNHVINYLPGLDLYLDATAKGIPFGDLPPNVAGKPVLRVDQPELKARTPAYRSERNRQRMTTHLTVSEDGSVKGKVAVEVSGFPAVSLRGALREMTQEQARDLVKNYFQSSGLVAQGSFRQDDPKPLIDSQNYDAQFEVAQMLPVPGAIPLRPMFMNPQPVASFVSSANEDLSAEGETACTGGRSEEIYRIEFPASMKVIAVPTNLSIESGGLRYHATYSLKGNVLEASRVFEDGTPGPLCTPEYNRAFQAFAKKVLPNLKSQVVYQ
ncbi:DUF3857 and transglutaminase domain-containing protein [Lysobacter sp. Root983]|uniref:DUF3857 domain-containing transglutaminase family protein n=1 Tax=Lysobacter sp. Root983 TaxID=1736613 RepID=UPI00070E7EE1|nr:DUF3857 and transglutaminase domain-containing protein [Lysobacter sp. Root983]KRD79875.1 hypothetical protein ASE43_02970 [Lysobacter sp. Root983]